MLGTILTQLASQLSSVLDSIGKVVSSLLLRIAVPSLVRAVSELPGPARLSALHHRSPAYRRATADSRCHEGPPLAAQAR